jgi:hypothetical protein
MKGWHIIARNHSIDFSSFRLKVFICFFFVRLCFAKPQLLGKTLLTHAGRLSDTHFCTGLDRTVVTPLMQAGARGCLLAVLCSPKLVFAVLSFSFSPLFVYSQCPSGIRTYAVEATPGFAVEEVLMRETIRICGVDQCHEGAAVIA